MSDQACPICGGAITIKPHVQEDCVKFSINRSENDQALLVQSLLNYWRWCAEGKPPYYRSSEEGPKQYYYDGYHNGVSYDGNGIYSFSIQTYDSPDGDTWWRGKFEFDGPNIKIMETDYSHL